MIKEKERRKKEMNKNMTVPLSAIHDEGLFLDLAKEIEWLGPLLKEALPVENPELSTLKGSVRLLCFEEQVMITGELQLNLKPLCDRCAELFDTPYHVDLTMTMLPHNKEWGDDAVDENVDVYKGEEINLGEIIREKVVFQLPPQWLCSELCKGLCQTCRTNLNRSTCDCANQKPIDPRWSVLAQTRNRMQ